MKNLFLVFLFFLGVSQTGFTQNKYWIFFKDKAPIDASQKYVSEATIQNRKQLGLPIFQETDVPICIQYKKAIIALDIPILGQSKWLNAVAASLSEEQMRWVEKLSFVKTIQPIQSYFLPQKINRPTPIELHLALQQMQADTLLQLGLSGKGIKVGVIDAGFYNANHSKKLKHLFDNEQIKSIKDFVYPNRQDHFTFRSSDSDTHGTQVLEMIAGQETDYRVGLATNASFYLARTENTQYEARSEEYDWVRALEWLDSLGVRVVNSSLGYGSGFNKASDNYTPSQMDGKTAITTQAAQIAVEQKGMNLIVSAGNEGNDYMWQIISSPADAEGVISVGAVYFSSKMKYGYSSVGTEKLPYVKPNIACFSPNGTSFSAPVIAGLVACMLERNPTLSNKEIKQLLEKSAHLYPFANTYIGYGVPQIPLLIKMIDNTDWENNSFQKIATKEVKYELLVSEKLKKVIVFHKKDEKTVISQSQIKVKKGRLLVKKKKRAKQSTLDLDGKVIEIVWE